MRGLRRVPWLSGLLSVALAGIAAPAFGHHTTFSASVDRFEVDGNVFGPADGVPDQVDEFDSGSLAPNWAGLVGTAIESGGVLTLRDPGLDVSLVPGVLLDVSNVENTHDVTNGAGNFTATSYWVPTPLAANREIHFQLYGLGATIEAAGITVQNLDAANAGPNPVGWSVTQSVSFILGGGGVPYTSTVPIDPADITGEIVLRMAFDDATDTMVCSFSLDGGLTFQSPFPPMPVFQVLDALEIILGAASISANTPPPPPPVIQYPVGTKLFLLKNRSVPAARALTYKVKDHEPFLGGSPPLAGATFRVQVGAETQCFHLPATGWKFISGGFRYRDDAGANGAVKAATVKSMGNGTLQAKIVALGKLGALNLVPPAPPAPAYMNLHLSGATPVEFCGSTAGGVAAVAGTSLMKIKDAPAPGACPLAACSPSGAFLDAP